MASESCNIETNIDLGHGTGIGGPASREINHGSAGMAAENRKGSRGNTRLQDYIDQNPANINAKELGSLVPQLLTKLCDKNKRKWVKPPWWPAGSFFGYRRHRTTPPKADLESMFTVLQQKYFEKCGGGPGHVHSVPPSSEPDNVGQHDNVEKIRDLRALQVFRDVVDTLGDVDSSAYIKEVVEEASMRLAECESPKLSVQNPEEVLPSGFRGMSRAGRPDPGTFNELHIITWDAKNKNPKRDKDQCISKAEDMKLEGNIQSELRISADTPSLILDTIPSQLLDRRMTDGWKLNTTFDTGWKLNTTFDMGLDGSPSIDQKDTPATPQPGRPPPNIPAKVLDLQDSSSEDESTYERPNNARKKAVKRSGGDGDQGGKRQRTT